jgi:hypothetical protein
MLHCSIANALAQCRKVRERSLYEVASDIPGSEGHDSLSLCSLPAMSLDQRFEFREFLVRMHMCILS